MICPSCILLNHIFLSVNLLFLYNRNHRPEDFLQWIPDSVPSELPDTRQEQFSFLHRPDISDYISELPLLRLVLFPQYRLLLPALLSLPYLPQRTQWNLHAHPEIPRLLPDLHQYNLSSQ